MIAPRRRSIRKSFVVRHIFSQKVSGFASIELTCTGTSRIIRMVSHLPFIYVVFPSLKYLTVRLFSLIITVSLVICVLNTVSFWTEFVQIVSDLKTVSFFISSGCRLKRLANFTSGLQDAKKIRKKTKYLIKIRLSFENASHLHA